MIYFGSSCDLNNANNALEFLYGESHCRPVIMNQQSVKKSSAAAFLNQDAELPPELTQRQQQILALIKAGKVNKEIANELGIGLGTVKQHVVALFKKLHVSNRTMAVSQGFNQEPEAPPEVAEISEGMLERRPCIVLSILLPDAVLKSSAEPRAIVQELHKTFSALASSHDALFLTSRNYVGDLIFGIKRGTEQDIFKALRAARAVFDVLGGYPNLTRDLRGGLAAGLAISSMNRHGGWSGEVVASAVIAHARELAGDAAPGEVALGATARKLLEITGPNANGFVIPSLLFKTLNRMPWGKNLQLPQSPQAGGLEESSNEPSILGRDPELKRLDILFSEVFKGKKNHLVYIEGETGMGKSLLCRYAAEHGLNMNGRLHHFVCHSGGKEGNLYMYPSGVQVKPQAMLNCLKSVAGRGHDVIIIDDAHLLPVNILIKATEAASAAKGKLVIVAARKFSKYAVPPSETIRLGHLSKTAIENLITQSFAQLEEDELTAGEVFDAYILRTQGRDQTTETIVRHAAGVPLFAIELARHHREDTLPLSLQVVINARMDGLKLDRALLRQVSKAPAPLSVAEIAEAMWEAQDTIQIAVEQAVASGVLSQNEDGRIAFVHPLLHMLVNQSGVE
ncbi:MAG: LuxR C-terminal-related transcriptional regulator [Methylobacter sp.]